jgi:hypothetical protein
MGEIRLEARPEWEVLLDMTGYEQEQEDRLFTKPVKQGIRWKGHNLLYQEFLVEQDCFKERDNH